MRVTRSQFSVFAGAVSITIQVFFVCFVAYLAHLFYRDVGLSRSTINVPSDAQNKLLYFSFLDYPMSNENGYNMYIFGEVSKGAELSAIIGHDCEPCQKEVKRETVNYINNATFLTLISNSLLNSFLCNKGTETKTIIKFCES